LLLRSVELGAAMLRSGRFVKQEQWER